MFHQEHENENDPSDFDPTEFFHRRGDAREGIFLLGGGGGDNDAFFLLLYDYYREGGFACIVLSQASFLLRSFFTILLTSFITTCMDWTSWSRPRQQPSEYVVSCDLLRMGPGVKLIVGVFTLWWVWTAWEAAQRIRRMIFIKRVWEGNLGLSSDVRFVDWPLVMTRYRERIDVHADAHFIINRIMRWDNYFIAILTRNVLSLDNHRSVVFSKLLELFIRASIQSALFRDDGILIHDVMRYARRHEYENRLRTIFRRAGIVSLLSAPFLLIAFTVYFAFRHFSEYHKNPETLATHCFTPLARWKLRNFNELPHSYLQRLHLSHSSVLNFMAQFASREQSIIRRCLSFLLGSLLMILVSASLLNSEADLTFLGFKRPILFFTGVVGALFVGLHRESGFGGNRGDATTPLGLSSPSPLPQPESAFDDVVNTLRCMPYTWQGMTLQERYREIQKLFRYEWEVFLPELWSVITLPIILFLHCPSRAEHLVAFFRENSIHVEKLGVICSSALFESGPRRMITLRDEQEGTMHEKMQASVANFEESYPFWKQQHVRRDYDATTHSSPQDNVDCGNVVFDSHPPFALNG